MSDHHHPAPPITDRSVQQRGNFHGTNDGYSGQEGGSVEHSIVACADPSASRGGTPADPAPVTDESRDIPPDAGVRAHVDQATGEVRGSGVGAGGGAPGEDYDSHTPGGSPRVPHAGAAPDQE
ncbi:MAG TPA: hypothetical protein VF695_16425 [Sphingomonas sp.]|jgi:hypothetical protein